MSGGLSKTDLAIVLYLQVESKIENYTKKDLSLLIEGREFPVESFQDYLDYTSNPEELKDFDEEALRFFLQMKYKRTFPFSISLFTGQKETLRKTILWWFEKYTDFDSSSIKVPSIEDLNTSQRYIISNIESKKRGKTLLQIVNAGPGTGKTTAANTLAYHLREEGVLLVSYTNESIKENYNRFFDFPKGKSESGLKKYAKNPINLITVDSLAARIIGDATDKNFDETVQLASIQMDPFKFVHPTRGRTYNHIIVDECQDIDELRGNFILKFCQKIGVKTLTLCGDPRQKIRANCGKWYSDLWESRFDFEKNGHISTRFDPVFRIGFEQSYRFERSSVVDLVNSLSEVRPGLHVSLQSRNAKEDPTCPIQIVTLARLDFVLEELLKSGESACIIGPSIEADNKTANIGRRLAAMFRSHGKALSFKAEGAFQPDSIPFLTIHSVKGKEFDVVFIFGMSNYPASFPMIPHDEALSLIFVAHSRARKRIYYIDGSDDETKGFILPLNVDQKYISSDIYEGTISPSYQDFDKLNSNDMRHYIVSTLVEDHSFTRFLEENRYTVHIKTGESYYFPDWKIEDTHRKAVSAELWGFMVGVDYQSQLVGYKEVFDYYFREILDDKYQVFTEEKVIEYTLEGKIVNSHLTSTGDLVLTHEVSDEDIDILIEGYKCYSLTTIVYMYNKIYRQTGETLDIKILRDLFPDGKHIVSGEMLREAIAGETNRGKIEVGVTDRDHEVLHGRCDYVDRDRNVYEIKSNPRITAEYKSQLQVWLYHVLIGDSNASAYLLDCQSGGLHEIGSEESIYRWRYILKCYFTLRHHVELVTARRNYNLQYGTLEDRREVNIPDNSFTCDTEFFGKDIFEIALVNINDPYKTIVDLIKPSSLEGMLFALDWLPGTQTEMYRSSIERLRLKFSITAGRSKETPSIGYYVASTDVDWCLRKDVKKIDLSPEARKKTESKGCFTSSSKGPKLGELYTLLAPFPLEYQKHLNAHTALSDALMLYELVHLGSIDF